MGVWAPRRAICARLSAHPRFEPPFIAAVSPARTKTYAGARTASPSSASRARSRETEMQVKIGVSEAV